MPRRRDCARLDAGVLGHAIAAGAREAVEPVGLDLVLRVEPERLLDLDLDPQPLAVEAVLVALVLAERRVVALEQVLQRAAPGVVHAHRVVGRDRAVDERVRRPAGVLLAQLLERAVALPALEHPVLERDVIGLGGDGCEGGIGGHRTPDRSRARAALTPGRTGTGSTLGLSCMPEPAALCSLMRRKPHVLVIVVGAAAVLLLSAPALGAAWLSTETLARSRAPDPAEPRDRDRTRAARAAAVC